MQGNFVIQKDSAHNFILKKNNHAFRRANRPNASEVASIADSQLGCGASGPHVTNFDFARSLPPGPDWVQGSGPQWSMVGPWVLTFVSL